MLVFSPTSIAFSKKTEIVYTEFIIHGRRIFFDDVVFADVVFFVGENTNKGE